MKIKVLQEDFSKSLQTVSRLASSHVQLPILANILLSAKKNKLNLSATNLELSVSYSVGAQVEKDGDIAVPSKTITDLISSLPSGTLSIETDKEKIMVKSDRFESSVLGMDSSDFPKIPNSIDKNFVDIESDLFENTISQVLYAVSSDETRPILTGILLLAEDDGLTLVATDGFRLSRKKLKLGQKVKLDFENLVIPKSAFTEVLRLAANSDKFKFSYDKDNRQVLFGFGGVVLSSRVIEGTFPDFQKIIPKNHNLKVDLDREEFLRAVKTASVFARDSANVVKLNVHQKDVEIFAESSQYGNQSSKVDANIEFSENADKKESFVIAFNYKFLEDFLDSSKDDETIIKLVDVNSPGVFSDPKDAGYLHLIMPIKI